MKLALIVGINYYEHIDSLHGCVNDARSVKLMLEHNEDGTFNFDCKLIAGTDKSNMVERGRLKDMIEHLFSADAEIVLFYFAGHGFIDSVSGYILGSDTKRGDDGISLSEILIMANSSPAKNKIIVLDSCHSGFAGNMSSKTNIATLSEGLTVLTASTKDQYASEEDGSGVFTSLFVDALTGSAANLTGDISPGSVYAHIDQSLSGWEQRPVFKTNVKQFVSLRKTTPPISVDDLRRIAEFFPTHGFEYPLDPTYEPEMIGRDTRMPLPIEKHTRIFSLLQKYNRLNLLVPNGAPHMWHAAMESKTCKLTALGEHYRRLVTKGRI